MKIRNLKPIFVNSLNSGIPYLNQAPGLKEVIIYRRIKTGTRQMNYITH